ncbi:CRISPR-associated protein, Csd1 family [Micromonospora pattaloongensis]|uniref:CRISPR-associated protein, Csd1 family n=1 Tax=Micromonospora pattaloongensis TaxID=405436 RepID=A0A1H3RFQ1_9ACTN|nr:type I-C CRISPR-associated protein Cas8c/Csd1 [Micromonospora pattaloongensis]SDZ24145.1 CRISPR-associated protein, Csd1 family [Micromonospora pattaloongensis]
MLLQRLVEYADTSEDVIPAFYARKPVRWSLEIDGNGVPEGDLVSTADKDDPQRRFGVSRLVPSVTRTVGISPALAVDNGEYVFGWLSEGAKPERVAKQHEAFRALITEWAAAERNGPGPAIAAFYRDGHAGKLRPPTDWSRGDLIGLWVDGVYAADTGSARRFWAGVAGDRKGSGRSGLCLVCGQVQPLLKTVPQQIPRRWVPGATQSASLVSMNEAVHGYELQKFLTNTPICADCGLKFMTALTGLLSDPLHSTALSGQNARLAWWVLGGSDFDPWATVEQLDPTQIQNLIAGPASGKESAADDLSRYCSVTVGGNVARVVVRDWVEQPIRQVKDNIRAWFDDHKIVDAWTGEVVEVKVSQLARAAGRFEAGRNGGPGTWTKFGASGEHRPPDLFHRLLGAALLKRPLPPKLLNHVINRIRIDGRLDAARAALIRLALRRHPNLPEHERERLTPTLSVEHKQKPAYVSGRIFAVMDDLQRTVFRVADQKLNTTFAERYFGRAIDNPQVVIVSGRRNVQAWLKRLRGPLRRPNWSEAYERRLDDLFVQLDAIPNGAVLTDKAQFVLGYHQQRAEMRTERLAAAANKKKTDLPPEPDDVAPTTDAEGDDA